MSAMYGYERGVNYTNDELHRNMDSQRLNNIKNLSDLRNYNVSEKLAEGIEKSSALSDARQQGADFLNDARNVYKTGKKLNSIYEDTAGAVRGVRRARALRMDAGDTLDPATRLPVSNEPRELDLGQDTTPLEEEFANRGGTAVSRGADLSNDALKYGSQALNDTLQGGFARGSGEAFTGTRSALNSAGETADASLNALRSAGAGDLSGAIDNLGSVAKGFSKTTGALDSLGKAGEGMAVLGGVSDVLDDADGKFNKMNTAEKVGNVAGITAGATGLTSLVGSLESGGAMLDATGIGAELGVGLQVAGGIASGVGAIADAIGGEEKQKQQLSKPMTMVSTNNAPQISATQSGMVASRSY